MGSYPAACILLLWATLTLGQRPKGCPQDCKCPENPFCPLGTALDTCGCGCLVCVQDIDGQCDGFRPCDFNKNLTCDYHPSQKQGVCKEREEEQAPETEQLTCKPTTEWTPCSKTCGFGSSIRITYKGESCTPKAERRLCIIRPCTGQYTNSNYTVLKSSNSCARVFRWSEPLHLQHRDCLSLYPLLPRFCGHCSDGRLCSPSMSDTRSVAFQCAHRNRKVYRQMMWVHRCNCKGKGRGKKKMSGQAMDSSEEDTSEIQEENEM